MKSEDSHYISKVQRGIPRAVVKQNCSRRLLCLAVSPIIQVCLLMFLQIPSFAQEVNPKSGDTINSPNWRIKTDTLVPVLGQDNSEVNLRHLDSLKKPSSSFGLEHQVKYGARDSILFNLTGQKVFLFGDARIDYGNITLKAAYIEIDFANKQAYAKGVADSTGKMTGEPVFSEGTQSFDSEILTYNFESKKGVIRSVYTKDGEGYLHGEKIKRMPDERINIERGWYTTCDLKEPHFEFRYSKAQVIPDNKIVSGPAYMVIEKVPVPLFIPFGFFPNKSGQRSGVLIPSFGETANRGFYLERGGYYWGINEYMDLSLTGDIFTSGSWAIRPSFRYNKRYHYNGNFEFNYAKNILGDRDDPDTEIKKDFSVRWTHSQDPKARPNSRFSASVNIVSSEFNEFNLTGEEAYLSNTFQSSIAYQTNWANKYFLTLNATHQQNTIDRSVNITLPSLTFNTKQFFPFRREVPVGKVRWYENINLKYSMNADNRITTKDTLLFKPGWEDDFKFGVRHSIPISASLKVLKFFTLTNSLSYNERWYPWSIRKEWVNDTIPGTSEVGYVKTDTVQGFVAARDFSFSASLSTRLYGMFQFVRGPVTAIRHMITPSVSFSLNPDFGSDFWGYYYDYQRDEEGNMGRYSIFEGSLYGGPPDGKSGRLSFSLTNNLEMKVRARNDTVSGFKKVVLIDNFTINTSYDIARDSLNWSPLTLSGRTTLFKKLNITYSSSWDPYILDSTGTRNLNQFEWSVNRRLFRLENTTWNFGLNYQLRSSDLKKGKQKTTGPPRTDDPLLQKYSDEEIDDVLDHPERYVDWNNAWSLGITYNLRLTNNPMYLYYERENVRSTVQSMRLFGDFNLTPKWKIGFQTNYDFTAKKFAYSSVDIYRDLHCWEMRFNWVPAGPRKSWNFHINIKASILKDLKYDRKKDFRDNY